MATTLTVIRTRSVTIEEYISAAEAMKLYDRKKFSDGFWKGKPFFLDYHGETIIFIKTDSFKENGMQKILTTPTWKKISGCRVWMLVVVDVLRVSDTRSRVFIQEKEQGN